MAALRLLREMVGRVLGRPWILIFIGGALLVLMATDIGRVQRCGGETMQQGDLCEYDSGRVTTYDEEVSDARIGGWVLAGGGFVLVGGGLYGLARKRLRTNEMPGVGASSEPFSPPPGSTRF